MTRELSGIIPLPDDTFTPEGDVYEAGPAPSSTSSLRAAHTASSSVDLRLRPHHDPRRAQARPRDRR